MPWSAYALQRFYITAPFFNSCIEQRIYQCECLISSYFYPSPMRSIRLASTPGNKRITHLPYLTYGTAYPCCPRINQTLTSATVTSFFYCPPQADVCPLLVQSSLPMSWEIFTPFDVYFFFPLLPQLIGHPSWPWERKRAWPFSSLLLRRLRSYIQASNTLNNFFPTKFMHSSR